MLSEEMAKYLDRLLELEAEEAKVPEQEKQLEDS